MSATTGIHSGVYGDQTIPWSGWHDRTQKRAVGRKQTEWLPGSWLWSVGQTLLALLYTLAMLPLIAAGTLVALVLAPWLILAPALVAGFVLALVSLVASAL